MSLPPNEAPKKTAFRPYVARFFRFHRQWAVDVDYLKRLPLEEREWMGRFLAEYYDADNKLLRPEQHAAKCRKCRDGGDCGKRPPPVALHATDEQRRDCYRAQNYANTDAFSRGRVALWEDYDGVDSDGNRATRHTSAEATRPRWEAGDFEDTGTSVVHAPSAPRTTRTRRR